MASNVLVESSAIQGGNCLLSNGNSRITRGFKKPL